MKYSMRILAVATAATLAVSANAGSHNLVTADVNDPVTLRINIMQNIGAATGLSAGMLKWEVPFDPITAQAALATINTGALSLAGLFPAGAAENMRSTAGPAIWSDTAGFNAAMAKFIADSSAAKAAAPSTIEEFEAVFTELAGNCKACHKSYRIKR